MVADAYEAYVGRWSRRLAPEFVRWLDQPAGGRWLDVGCGTGALTSTVRAAAAPATLVGVDLSDGFLDGARAAVPDTEFHVADAMALPFDDASFDAVVSGLALNFVPDPGRAAAEFVRVVRPGGLVAGYVWDYAEGVEFMRIFWDAARMVDPGAPDEAQRFPICQPGPLRSLWLSVGLDDVQERAIVIPTVFESFDDYWTPFLGGTGAAPAYLMSLPEDRQAEVRDLVRERLATMFGGPISLLARAWAVRGRRPLADTHGDPGWGGPTPVLTTRML
jgi:SAM-dependent methyltransferase